MLFDAALTIMKGQQIRRAKRAIVDRDWETVIKLIEAGLDPNQKMAAKGIDYITRQGPKYTTPLLALSMVRIESEHSNLPTKRRALALMLENGGDPLLAVEGDQRNALVHMANIRNLEGWKLIAQHGIDLRKANLEEIIPSWNEGSVWAADYRAQKDADDLNLTTVSNSDTTLKRPRF